ncbi:MAG TPA: tRNA uridine-5-carboxymethylaminomethyl(34) synthesis GTPase MnmE [Acidisarcina sp.]
MPRDLHPDDTSPGHHLEPPSNETIVAISTPPGRGGIGIVRLSGSQSVAIASRLVRLRNPLAHAQARFGEVLDPERISREAPSDLDPATLSSGQTAKDDAALKDGGAQSREVAIDQAIVTWFRGPDSYTGEDLVEIAAHGSPVVLELLVRQALAHGATLADPGEFTQRAFLSGRIDLTQAEAVRDLIEAETLYQVRVAARQMGGALSHRIKPIKQSLVELIALLEAGIDFAEDDIDLAPDTEILLRIGLVRDQLLPVLSSFVHGRIVHAGMTLAIVGRPNVGKSSLFNRLVERERAIVTATPGTTRDLVTERVSLGGIPVELVDTAGLREAFDEAEALGIRKSREALADADIVLVVIDATMPLAADERTLLDSLSHRPVLLVRNKSDLIADHGQEGAPDPPGSRLLSEDGEQQRSASPHPSGPSTSEAFSGGGFEIHSAAPQVHTSAVTGEGIEELRRQMLNLVRGGNAEEPAGMLTNLRQSEAVTATLAALASATEAVSRHIPHEMVLLDLYAALRHLDSLTGETTPDDILNLIFSSFCIGK